MSWFSATIEVKRYLLILLILLVVLGVGQCVGVWLGPFLDGLQVKDEPDIWRGELPAEELNVGRHGWASSTSGKSWGVLPVKADVVFFGDSNVANSPFIEIGVTRGVVVTKRGVTGGAINSTAQLVKDHLPGLEVPAVVFNAGTNDIKSWAFSREYMLSCYRELLELEELDGKQVVVLLVPHIGAEADLTKMLPSRETGEMRTLDELLAEIDAFNLELAVLCKERGVAVVDPNQLDGEILLDGVHYRAEAARDLFDAVMAVLEGE